MKFKVLAGKHRGADGRIYNAGSIVESETNLVKVFPNKFQLVDATKKEKARAEEEGRPKPDSDLAGTAVKDTDKTKKAIGAMAGPKLTKVAGPEDDDEDDEEFEEVDKPKKKPAAKSKAK